METIKRKCKVIILPTKDRSEILMTNKKLLYKGNRMEDTDVNQHLYITSDDEIKGNNWCIMFDSMGNVFSNPQQYKPEKGHILNKGLKKIIATTDNSLTQTIIEGDKGKITKRLPQIPQLFIEKYCQLSGIDKVLVEYEPSYLSILKEKILGYKLKTDSYNTITIESSEEKMYSKEELIQLSMGQSDIIDWIKETL